jgi:hypothetical protein
MPRQSRSTPTTFNQSPSVRKEPDVVPMEIDSGRRNNSFVCYKCRKPGHIARHCQSKVDVRIMDYESIKSIIKEEMQNEGFQESHQ